MIRLTEGTVFPFGGTDAALGRKQTMAYQILTSHDHSDVPGLRKLKFDALVSPDNNYVNILQTLRASGIEQFPVPYVLSNCHHTLCAVGGTINEDDHVYGMDCAKKYGGIFLPPHRGVLHQYMRESWAGCGRMILGSDSHSRYGPLGTMGIGEGGGEVAKQLLGRTYDLPDPQIIAVKLTGSPRPGVGPMDVALTLIGATFKRGFCKNKVLEFIGEGISGLSMEYRLGIDVMTTESAALSSIWCTDEKTRLWLKAHGREADFAPLAPGPEACYDGMIEIDLGKVECMIALPFHPSNALPIREFLANSQAHLDRIAAEGTKIKGSPFCLENHWKEDGFYVNQALVSGCSGGMTENLAAVADILREFTIPGDGLQLGVNPASMPVMQDLMDQGIARELMLSGVTLRPAICGPCFGVTDVPADGQLSIRHVTRNYANREGSKPGQGQMAAVCIMDARSIAATVRMGGRLTPATDLEVEYRTITPGFDCRLYDGQVYNGFGRPQAAVEPVMGPNIADWPEMPPLGKHLLVRVAGSYPGSVTTDELIPSGEASSYRSNPERIAGYTLINKDSDYVNRTRTLRGQRPALLDILARELGCRAEEITFGSAICADEIGDGSSREQAASCQKVLGGFANIASAYATKRYRSNCVNWGILPLRTDRPLIECGGWVLIRDIRQALEQGESQVTLEVLDDGGTVRERIPAFLEGLTEEDRQILASGCLINYNRPG